METQTLTARYPGASIISSTPDMTPEDLTRLVQPYLGWQLAEVDIASTDVLIWNPGLDPTQPQQIVILKDSVARLWLRYHQSAETG